MWAGQHIRGLAPPVRQTCAAATDPAPTPPSRQARQCAILVPYALLASESNTWTTDECARPEYLNSKRESKSEAGLWEGRFRVSATRRAQVTPHVLNSILPGSVQRAASLRTRS